MKILGILNITSDSFSDGGKYLAPDAALRHADALLARAAPTSSISARPRPIPMPSRLRLKSRSRGWRRWSRRCKAKGAVACPSTAFRARVQRWALAQGVDYLNDIHGFADAALYPELRRSSAKLIVMHMVQERRRCGAHRCPVRARFSIASLAFFDARHRGADRLPASPASG